MAASAEAVINPTPGIVASLRLSSLVRCHFLIVSSSEFDLGLQRFELRIEGFDNAPNERRNGKFVAFRSEDPGDELRHPLYSLGRDYAEFR